MLWTVNLFWMWQAFVVERYNKPMPKLRTTKPDSGGYEERPVPPGSLNVAQLRHIILLHQGKADDHKGPMNVQQIAEKFRIDVKQVEGILQFLSLPPEDSSKQKDNIWSFFPSCTTGFCLIRDCFASYMKIYLIYQKISWLYIKHNLWRFSFVFNQYIGNFVL